MTEPAKLTEEGASRRARILDEALRAQRWRVRRRRAAQGTGVALVIALAAILSLQIPTPTTDQGVTPPPPRASAIDVVRTSPDAFERVAIAPAATSIEQIGDQELLEILRTAGHDAALIRTQGRVVILGAEVTRAGDESNSAG